jgi:hypothetical protein
LAQRGCGHNKSHYERSDGDAFQHVSPL